METNQKVSKYGVGKLISSEIANKALKSIEGERMLHRENLKKKV